MNWDEVMAEFDRWAESLAASDQTDLAVLVGHATYLLRSVWEEEGRRYES